MQIKTPKEDTIYNNRKNTTRNKLKKCSRPHGGQF